MSESKAIELELDPIEKDYEDFICAYLQSGGLYVEKSIIHREVEEILELDVIATDFRKESIEKKLIEIKSKKWGYSEIFKVKGWLVFLGMEKGLFIVKQAEKNFSYFQEKAAGLSIELIDNSDLSKTNESLEKFLCRPADDLVIETVRFSYLLERKLLKQIKDLKKKFPDVQSYKNLDDYFFKVNSGSFFSNNPIKRIKQLFETFIKYKNITAKLCHELETGKYDESVEDLSKDCFKQLFFQAKDTPLNIGLYIEHIARVTILKCCIEHLLNDHQNQSKKKSFKEKLEILTIPSTIKNGLEEIAKEPYFHRYPAFWQFFTYVMGGFILTDLKDEEYKYLSEHTLIPIEEIPKALECYNKLFPKASGWMYKFSKSNIELHSYFPLPFCGNGANHRRDMYLGKENNTYEDLEKKLKGEHTMSDLIKWNNLCYRTLQ